MKIRYAAVIAFIFAASAFALPPRVVPRLATSFCGGTATSSATLSPYGMGGSLTTCTGTTSRVDGLLMTQAGTVSNLSVRCVSPGVSSSSGVFTVYDTPAGSSSLNATAITLTYGTSSAETLKQDTTHTFNYAAGDILTVRFTTQGSETLGNCTVSFNY